MVKEKMRKRERTRMRKNPYIFFKKEKRGTIKFENFETLVLSQETRGLTGCIM
jgi:hypothetical protein